MARFIFKLDPLLHLRHREEQEEQRKVAQLEAERMELEGQLRHGQQRITVAKQDLRTELIGTLNAPQLRLFAGAALHQVRDAQRLAVGLAGVHSRLKAARILLAEAVKRRRAIELLRERRYEVWRTQLDKAEVAALDELAIIAAARKDSSS